MEVIKVPSELAPWVCGVWCVVWGLGFRLWGFDFRALVEGCRVFKLGFIVWGLGFRV